MIIIAEVHWVDPPPPPTTRYGVDAHLRMDPISWLMTRITRGTAHVPMTKHFATPYLCEYIIWLFDTLYSIYAVYGLRQKV
jgi:hypothetical protein